MKRIQTCKKVNRNNSFNNLNRKVSHLNAVSPEILVGQIWLQEDEPTAVEIIELNTSDEFDSSPDETLDKRLDHAWSYTNNEKLQQMEDNYKINKKAREKRRLNNENHFHVTNTATNTNNQFINNHLFSDIVENQYIEDNQLINHQVNCFTIINKHFINSDTSSDADIEIIASNDIIMEPNNWDANDHPFNEEIITFDPESGKETRTVWIYSFKNKPLLTKDDYESNNIAAKEMSSCTTSSSTQSDEEQTKDKSTNFNVRRLGSPIPPTYVPRLNLSLGPTLSTVTEVSEPNKQTSPNPLYKSPKNRFQKPRNSWVMNESEKLDRSVHKLEKSTNILNWMALSPREKRRRSKEQGDKWEGSLLKLQTMPTEELLENNQHHTQDKSGQDNALRLQVDVDVHVSVNDKTPEKRSLGTPNSANVTLKSNTKDKSPAALLKCDPVGIKDALDRGDHMKFEQTQQVLCFTGGHIFETMQQTSHISHLRRVGPFLLEQPKMTLDPVAWEREEREEKETASYDYLTDKLKCAAENADQAWMKNNAPFLKPSTWDNYAGIAESPLTIQMSIADIATDRDPWFIRFLKSINCCK